jgi:hypothetical protein
MTADHPDELVSARWFEGEKASAWKSVLVAAVEGGAEEGGKVLVAEGLTHLIGVIAALSVARGIVAAVAALFRRLFDQSEATAKLTNIILDGAVSDRRAYASGHRIGRNSLAGRAA